MERAAATADVEGFDALVGPLGVLRAAKATRAAAQVVGKVRERSELVALWAGDLEWSAGLDELTGALQAPLQRWTVSDLRAPKVLPDAALGWWSSGEASSASILAGDGPFRRSRGSFAAARAVYEHPPGLSPDRAAGTC